MPNYKRSFQPGGTYFFTVNTYRRQSFLTAPAFRIALRQAILETRKATPFKIDAWVLLPDHLHCIWTLPEGDDNYSRRWADIKRLTTKQTKHSFEREEWLKESRKKRGESTIWQRRFWEHLIRDEKDYQRHLDYIYWNPVKHGLVKSVHQWDFSTFHRDVRKGLYPLDWCGLEADSSEVGRDFGEWFGA